MIERGGEFKICAAEKLLLVKIQFEEVSFEAIVLKTGREHLLEYSVSVSYLRKVFSLKMCVNFVLSNENKHSF